MKYRMKYLKEVILKTWKRKDDSLSSVFTD